MKARRWILQDRRTYINASFAGTFIFSVAISICFFCMIGMTECSPEDAIDDTEGSTGEVDTTSWTSWSMWSRCSERCGGGLSNRTRYCATLTDLNADVGENSCIGNAKEVRVCNRQKCPSGGRRQSYCLPLMNRFFHGKRYYWTSYSDPRRPCKAMCHARTGNYYVPTGDTLPDGTPCYETGDDVCISGRCHKVGCDGIIGSAAVLDLCGVCKGEETTCRVVRSNITVDASLMQYGYNRIMTIPKGAYNINITELQSSRNYLAMKTKSGYSILNNHWRLSHYGYKHVLGTVLDYQRRSNASCPATCVFIVGPINDDIHVQLLFYRESSHFAYQFSTPLDMNGGQNHIYDITGDSGHPHRHHNHHRSQPRDNRPDNRHNHRTDHHHQRRIHERRRPSTATEPDTTDNDNDDSKKRRMQYNESFMGSHRSQSDSAPTNPSPESTSYQHTPQSSSFRSTSKKSYVSPTSGTSVQRTVHSLQYNGGQVLNSQDDRRNLDGNVDRGNRHQENGYHRNGNSRTSHQANGHYRNSHQGNGPQTNGNQRNVYHENGHQRNGDHETSHYNLPIRIANRRTFIGQNQPIEPNQPVRQGGASIVLGAPSPTIVIANSRYSSDRIQERQQPVKMDNRNRYFQTDQGTSQLSLGSNSVRPSGQGAYLHTGTGARATDVLGSSKSGSNTAGETTGYSWRISGFTECSQSCGGGVEETIVVCVKDNSQVVVTDENCDIHRKPETKTVSCNLIPCHAEWFAGPWSECSATCGPGTQTRQVTCQQLISPVLNLTVSAEGCRGQVRNTTNRTCSLQPCFFWKVANWSQCSSTCGKGMRVRTVTCMHIGGKPADEESRCQEVIRPNREEFCDMGSCATGWFYTDWPQKCPVECGEGIMKRNLHCAADDNTTLPDERCNRFPRPRLEKKCKADFPCGGKWFLGPWSKCNTTCGKGMETRDVVCIRELSGAVLMVVPENNCAMEDKPAAAQHCQREPCLPQWYMMNWSKCSKSCDLGHRTREVKCLGTQRRPSLACDLKTKPSIRESCNLQSCGMTTPAPVSGCTDILGQCHLVVRARLCNYHYYHRICCASCKANSEHEEGGHNGVSLGTTLAAAPTSVYSNTPSYSTSEFTSSTDTTLVLDNTSTLTSHDGSKNTTPYTESTISES